MYTLKIKWTRYLNGDVADETTLFIPAEKVYAHALVTSDDQMKAWKQGEFLDYRDVADYDDGSQGEHKIVDGRLINVERADKQHEWYLASRAWVLGPDGKTIERLN